MKLRHSILEKKIKRSVRTEVRASKSLRAEAKKFNPSFWKSHLPAELGGFILILGIICVILANSRNGTHMLVFTLLATSAPFFLCSSFLSNLRKCNDLFILSHYPLRDESYFSLEWRKCVRASLFILILSLIYFSGHVIVNKAGLTGELGWITVFSTVNWLVSLLMVIALTYFFRRVRYYLLGFIGTLAAITIVVMSNYMPSSLSLDGQWLMWLIPSGIISRMFISGEPVLRFLSLLGLLSIPAILAFYSKYCSAYRSEDIYESYFLYGEEGYSNRPDGEIQDGAESPEISEVKFPSGLPKRPVGWVERTVIRFLDRVELVKAPYIYNDFGTNWSACWKYGSIMMAICIASMAVYPKSEKIAVIGAILAFIIGIPVLGGTWRCFNSFYWHPGFYQFNLAFPVSYWRTSMFIFKANLIRIILWVPVTLAAGAFMGWHFRSSTLVGIVFSSELLLMMAVLQPSFISIKFGLLNSDSEITFWHIRKCFITCALLLTEVILIICSGVLSVYGVSGSEHGLILAGILLAGFFSMASWAVNGAFFDKSRADFGVRRYRAC